MKLFGPQKINAHAWVKKCHFGNFLKRLSGREKSIIFIYKVPVAPFKCLVMWIKVDKGGASEAPPWIILKSACAISKILFNLGSCIRSYAWSFGHSDPDLSSVYLKNTIFFLT